MTFIDLSVYTLCIFNIYLSFFHKKVRFNSLEKAMIRQALENASDAVLIMRNEYDPEKVADTLKTLDKIKEKIK